MLLFMVSVLSLLLLSTFAVRISTLYSDMIGLSLFMILLILFSITRLSRYHGSCSFGHCAVVCTFQSDSIPNSHISY